MNCDNENIIFFTDETIVLDSGPLEHFSHAIEPQLRLLGMPTELKKGIVNLTKEFTVCKEGDKLSSEQARILKLLGHKQAKFKLNMIAVWSKEDESFKILRDEPISEENTENNDMMEDEDASENESDQ